MKRILSSAFSAAFLALASLPVMASETVAVRNTPASSSNMSFSFSAPFISSSGLRGDHHIIRVTVVGMALEDLTVNIPSQMEKFTTVRILDESGQSIPAKINASQAQVQVDFDRPVQPGTTVALDISGVNTFGERGNILLYGVMGRRTGVQGSIPIGTARIQVPSNLDGN